MSTYLLIHGGWHGAWCWDKVTPLLEAAGHTVIAPDLPGHGNDKTPIKDVTLDLYAQATVDFAAQAEEPVIVVGHSMTGLSNSQAVEMAPEKFKAQVFMAAFLLPSGKCLLDQAQPDVENLVLRNLTFSEDRSRMEFNLDAVDEALYGECSAEDVARAKTLLHAQASAPFGTPVQLSEARWGRVPRYYVTCLRDQAITPKSQKAMYTANPCKEVFTIDTDHSPFLSRPEELVEHLLTI